MVQTVKRFIIICFMCQLSLPLIFSFDRVHASVITEMNEMNSIDALKQLYEKSNEYNRRYMLKNISDWFEKNEISEVNEWVYSKIDEAFESNRPMLIKEAIVLAGKIKYESVLYKLMNLYKNIHSLYPAEANHIRSEIINTVCSFSEEKKKNAIIQLVMCETRCMLTEEFKLLISVAISYSDPTILSELNKISSEIQARKSKLNPERRIYNRYNSLSLLLDEIGPAARKGGTNE